MLNTRERVMTQEEIENLKAKLGLTAKAGAATIGFVGAVKIVNVLSVVVDKVITNVGSIAINSFDKFATKISAPIVFPYVATFSNGTLLLGAFTAIALMILYVAVSGVKSGDSIAEIIFSSFCVLAPIIAWILMGGI